jgi:hypothetical protein
MRRPDFFIVGAPKCGTTSLWTYLREHPEVFMSAEKELYFFSTDLTPPDYSPPPAEIYLEHFAAARDEKRIGEATPDYLRSEVAPRAIKAFSPGAQIIITLRNPVDVMHSLHANNLYVLEPIDDFEAALEADAKRAGRQLVGYRQFTNYAEQVKRYFDVFGRDRVHVIIFDDLKANPALVYQDILHFLGVDPNFLPEFEIRGANERVRSKRLQRFLVYPPRKLRLLGRALVPQRLRPRVKRMAVKCVRTTQPRTPVDLTLRRRLQAEFEPKIEQLSALLGRDLSGWLRS